MLLTLTNLRIPIAVNKTQGPCTSLEFMGIPPDSTRMEARLPRREVSRIQTSLIFFKSRKSYTLKELQVLMGTLKFACSQCGTPPPPPPTRRPFLQRMIELTRKVSQPYHHIKLSSGFFKDLRMWQDLVSSWNGASLFFYQMFGLTQIHFTCVPIPLVLWVLAVGIFGSQWFKGRWRAHQQLGKPGLSIAWQELSALVVACHLWGSFFQNKLS